MEQKERQNKKTVLVVDDNLLDVKLAADLLELNGYNALKAVDGKEAIEITNKKRPDLILLDIVMPGLDGYETCKRIKSSKETQFIPIVMITSFAGKEDKIKGIEAGADDFISKPFDKDELLARVRSLLRMKILYDELEYSYVKLKELETMKDILTHMIVHDMNNPLMVIAGRLRVLDMDDQGDFTEEQKESLKAALRASKDLIRMILDLLDINKMGEGKLKLNYENFRLDDIIKETVDQMRAIARDQDKDLSLDIIEGMPDISADKELIRRVTANLIDNAIKYAPPKSVVQVRVFHEKDDNNFYVQVKDFGEGIPKEYLNRIFDKFIQVETVEARAGCGLGLTFCRMAVEAHGGKIRAESEPGKGSIFTFTLPRKE